MSSGGSKDIRFRSQQPNSYHTQQPLTQGAPVHSTPSGSTMNPGGPPSSAAQRANRSLLFGGASTGGTPARPYPGQPGASGTGAGGAYEREMMERDNNAQVDGLNDKVSVMKDLAIQIGNEVDYQNRMLDKMDSGFDSAQGLLGGTMERLNDMVASGNGGTPLCYLVAFILAVFFALYLLFRR